MAWTFNPFTGSFDQKGSGGGGSSYLEGEVQNFSALPTSTPPAVDAAYLVREAEGAWLLNRKPAGIYIRVATTGTRATDWTYAGEFPDVFNDANLVIYNDTDSTKNVKFDVSAVTTGTTRTLTAPDASGRIQVEGQAIGDTTPAAGSFTTLNSTIASGVGITVTDTNTSADANNLIDCVRDSNSVFLVRDDGIVTASTGVNASTNAGLVTASGGNGGVRIRADYTLHWVSTGFTNTGTPDTFLRRDGQANTLAMHNSTNAQEFRLYNTYTSSTNHERGFLRWSSNVLQIGTEAGASGGSIRAIEFITVATGTVPLRIETNGELTARSRIYLSGGSKDLAFTGVGSIAFPSTGTFSVRPWSGSAARINIGGDTSSFPSIKRDSTTLQARLADDSAFTAIQGKLTTETAYTAGAPTATGYLVIYDSNGTAYKVPAEAL